MRKIYKYSLYLSVVFIALIAGVTVQAHHPTINAQVSNDIVKINSSLENSQIKIYAGDKLIGKGKTDKQGDYSFPIPKLKQELKIVVSSSLGHRAEATIKRESLTTNSSSESDARIDHKQLDDKKVKRLVAAELEKQLQPINEQLQQLKEQTGPDLSEIIGGLGYIVGFLGLFYAYRAREDESNC